MRYVVAGIGVLIVLIGLTGLVAPGRFRAALIGSSSQARFLAAIILRLGGGVVIWFAAIDLIRGRLRRLSDLRRDLN